MFQKFSFLFAVAALLFSASPVLAADLAPDQNPVCWTQADCLKVLSDNGWKGESTGLQWEKNSPEECGPVMGACYPAGKAQLSITLGNQAGPVANLGDYIKKIYLYLIGIGALVATILIIKGGFEWATSAGNPARVTSAKSSITGALLGLCLLLGSYTLLYTINPDLLRLKTPRVYMIRPKNFASMQDGSPCFTKKDANSCAAACPDCKCRPLQISTDNFISKIQTVSRILTTAPFALEGGAVIGTARALSTLKTIGQVSWEVLKFAVRNPTLAAGGATVGGGGATVAAIWGLSTESDGEPGICMAMPKNLPDGALCDDKENQCKKDSTCRTPTGAYFGVCSSGGKDSYCQSSGDCLPGFICEKSAVGYDLSFCVSAAAGAKQANAMSCSSDADCESGFCGYNSHMCVDGTSECGMASPYCAGSRECTKFGNVWNCVNPSNP